MTITPTQLADWQRLAEAATKGPWVSTELTGNSDTDLWGYLIEGPKYLVHHEHEFFYKKDSDFIAVARSAVPELVREVERLRALLLLAHKTLAAGPVSEIESTLNAIEAALEVKA